jgi:hypothetical protein
MATALGTAATATKTRRITESGETVVVATFAVPATGDGTAANDVIQMVKVPKGAVITDVTLGSTDVDTNGTPLHEVTVGDTDGTDDPDRYITASTIGRTAGVARLNGVGFGYTFTADGTIDITVTAASATKAAGTFTLAVRYVLQK